jgi:hypothetical protein
MRYPFKRSSLLVLGLLVVLLAMGVGFWGCSDKEESPTTPQTPPETGMFTASNPMVQSIMAVQDRHTARLMADPEIIGTATTLTDNGRLAIMVLATTDRAAKNVPSELDGVPVVVHRTEKIVAMKTTTVSHTAKQTPPIQLGTSGGWRYDLANGYCCGGTLGSLIQVGGQKRILTNYHVFEADIVSGGNGRVATTGDPVIQPGLIDVGCVASSAQDVATLVVSHSLPNNNVDCSSATIIPGMVSENGAILEVGTLSAQTIAASVGQAVKKSGRTTGLTRSTVSGLNGTVSIAYENECAGGAAFTKTFTGQILVTQKASKFLASGDSGSLMVQDVTTNPKAVGLLFAGSSSLAIANPIGQVLSFFGATMVGQ